MFILYKLFLKLLHSAFCLAYNKRMNNLKNKIAVRLGIVSLLFLAAAISLWIFQHDMEAHSLALLERMHRQAQDRTDPSVEMSAEGISPPSEVLPEEPEETLVSTGDADENSEKDESGNPTVTLVDNPYADSFLANGDMAAWLKIEGTVIDYPVMWTPRDETYYLNRNFEGKNDKNGCLLLDTDSCLDPLTTNQIIHGHNMKSGAMFGTLMKYEDESYCREHNIITLYTEQCERRYEVLAVFRSQVYKKKDQVFKFYKFFQADTAEEFDDFYQNIKALSLYDTGVTAEFGDRFITLSTCAYHVEQGRFVVVAKEIESGDFYNPIRETQETIN